jgi:hypothetical protein
MPKLWIQNEEGRLRMSHREQEYISAFFATIGISILPLIIISSSGRGTPPFRTATAQQESQQNAIDPMDDILNQTSNIENQSSAIVGPTQNQTTANQTGTAALSANLTQSDFDLLKQHLTEARQALENSDTTALLDELNSASGELFQVSSRQFDPDHVEAMTEEFNPLQTHIDRAQESTLKDNHTGTLQELSAAESELSAIVQTLPSG